VLSSAPADPCVLILARQVDDGQLAGPAGLLQRAMERGLTIGSLSDLVPGSRPHASAGNSSSAGHSRDPDFDSPAWVSAVGSMAFDDFDSEQHCVARHSCT